MLESILAIYPEAILNPRDIFHLVGSHILITVQGELVAIPRANLSVSERDLLLSLDENTTQPLQTAPTPSIWQDFLSGASKQIPIISGNLVFLHLHFNKSVEPVDYPLWFTTLSEADASLVDWFAHDPDRFTLIVKVTEHESSIRDRYEGLIQTLNTDFDTITRVIQGFQHKASMDLPKQYQTELQIADSAFLSDLSRPYTLLTPLLLQQIGHVTLQHFPFMQPIQQYMQENPEYLSLVQTLFEFQGNLSQTADRLYIHRNTLSYRIQKFHKETGLQLNYLPDLVLCFLCLP